MIRNLKDRHREPEWMDEPDADPKELARSLVFIRQINQFLGYTRATLTHLKRFSRNWKPGQTIRILDVATGSGDIPMAILDWAKRAGFDVQIVAVDLHEQTLLAAAEQYKDPNLSFMRADATALPFENRSFDYAITSMFLHHLDEPVVMKVLSELDRVTRTGVLIADLLRSRRAYFWISLFTLLANPMVRHDAKVSVSGAFTQLELLGLRDRAGLTYLKPTRHFGHRLVLAGEKV